MGTQKKYASLDICNSMATGTLNFAHFDITISGLLDSIVHIHTLGNNIELMQISTRAVTIYQSVSILQYNVVQYTSTYQCIA